MARKSASATEKAIASIRKNEDEHKVYKKLLQKHVKHEKENDMRVFHWELGQLICQATEDAKQEGKHYGENFVERFGVALGYETGSVLRTSARVYERWPEEKDGSFNRDFKKILSMKNSANRGLSWTHISHLYWQKDKELTLELVHKCLDNCWNAKELHQAIQKERNSDRKGVGGRKHSIPKDASDAMHTMTTQFETMLSAWENGWFGDDFNLLSVIKNEPVSDTLRDKVQEMVASLDALSKKLNSASPKFDKLVESMTKELNGEIVKKIRSSSEQKEERRKRLQKKSYAAKTAKV